MSFAAVWFGSSRMVFSTCQTWSLSGKKWSLLSGHSERRNAWRMHIASADIDSFRSSTTTMFMSA